MSQFNRQRASTPAEIPIARRSAALASARQRRSSTSATMRPTDFFSEDDQGSTMAMDVDDLDPLEYLGGDGVIGDNKLADQDFFNSFEDDFDESDMTAAPAN